jgi:hypothetical protein
LGAIENDHAGRVRAVGADQVKDVSAGLAVEVGAAMGCSLLNWLFLPD